MTNYQECRHIPNTFSTLVTLVTDSVSNTLSYYHTITLSQYQTITLPHHHNFTLSNYQTRGRPGRLYDVPATWLTVYMTLASRLHGNTPAFTAPAVWPYCNTALTV